MKKHIRPSLAVAALALGAALASAPALAQKANNDGGTPPEPAAQAVQSQSKSTAIATNPYYGRNANDGGTGAQPTDAQLKAAAAQSKGTQQASAPHMGKPLDDGGM
jgi:hypothetical protein